MKKIFVTLFLLVVFINSFAAVPEFTDPNKPISVSKNKPTAVIYLQSNPASTGYSWYLTNYNSALINPVAHKFNPADSKLIGAPGYESWTFRLTSKALTVPQVVVIEMKYMRPWEKNNAEPTTFHFVVTN
jgi:predicted secreted protein